MQSQRYVVFMKAELMQRARELGITNFSGWVNKKVLDFVQEQDAIEDNLLIEKATQILKPKK